MQSKGIFRSYVPQNRCIPGDWPRCRDQIQRGRRQRRHVQRLANMASRLRPTLMMVQERAARSKEEQHRAAKHRQRAVRNRSPRYGSLRSHNSTI